MEYDTPVKFPIHGGKDWIQGRIVYHNFNSCLIWTGVKPVWININLIEPDSNNDILIPIEKSIIKTLEEYSKDHLRKLSVELNSSDLYHLTKSITGAMLRSSLNEHSLKIIE